MIDTQLEDIKENTIQWSKYQDIRPPINGSDINGFNGWVNLSSFLGDDHKQGYRYSSYLTDDSFLMFGLPNNIPIRAVADGIVKQISDAIDGSSGYNCFLNIEHGRKGSGLESTYHHIKPIVKTGDFVLMGEKIADLYIDSDEGRPISLMFEMRNGLNAEHRTVNPANIFPNLNKYRPLPQDIKDIKITDVEKQPIVYVNRS